MKVKEILLDSGGVYLKGSFVDFVNKAYKMLNIDKKFEASNQVVFDPNLNRGTITAEECFRKHFNVPISENKMKKLVKLWNNTWIVDKEMIRLVKLLKRKNYRVAIFSNSEASNDKVYRKKGWYDYFDHLILSDEIGIIKPDERIYRIALKELELKPSECLFVDDQKDCLVPAKKLGMKTLLFESTSKLKKDLRKMEII